MVRWWRGLVVVGLLLAAPTLAQEADGLPFDEPIWPADAMAPPIGLAMRPPGWQSGDATAILLPAPAWPPGLRDRLAQALVQSGTAVLALTGDRGAEAAELARRDGGILIVLGPSAAAASGVTAAIGLEPGRPRIEPGPPPPPGEGWALRAPMLCRLLATALRPAAMEAWVAQCVAGLLDPRPARSPVD